MLLKHIKDLVQDVEVFSNYLNQGKGFNFILGLIFTFNCSECVHFVL